MWVCGSCEEKRKTDRKNELDASAQARNQAAGAAFRERSVTDIAEVLARSTLRQYAAFVKTVSEITGGDIQVSMVPAFMFVLFAQSRIVLKGIFSSQLDGERVERIHDLLVRYSLAQLIHVTVRNSPPGVVTEPIDRVAMLSKITATYGRAAEALQQNTMILLKTLTQDPAKLVEAMIGFGVRQFFVPEVKFAELLISDKEKFASLLQCVLQILTSATSLQETTKLSIEAIATPVNRSIAVELPDSWLLRQTDPWFIYYDPSTPQYNLQITVQAVASDKSPLDVVRKTLTFNALDIEPEMLSPIRATAHYRIEGQEKGEAKDDYHWVVVEQHATQLRYALFTLSTLVGRADSNVTTDLVQSLHPRIQQAQFLM